MSYCYQCITKDVLQDQMNRQMKRCIGRGPEGSPAQPLLSLWGLGGATLLVVHQPRNSPNRGVQVLLEVPLCRCD